MTEPTTRYSHVIKVEGEGERKKAFTVSSIPPDYHRGKISPVNFIDYCSWCRRTAEVTIHVAEDYWLCAECLESGLRALEKAIHEVVDKG